MMKLSAAITLVLAFAFGPVLGVTAAGPQHSRATASSLSKRCPKGYHARKRVVKGHTSKCVKNKSKSKKKKK